MGSLDSVPFYLRLCATFSRQLMVLVPPISPLRDSLVNQAPCLPRKFARTCISISSSGLLSIRISFICRRPPSSDSCHPPSVRLNSSAFQLTAGQFHAAPSFLSSVPMFEGFPPGPMRLVVLGSGVDGGAYETVPPPMLLRSSMRVHHTQ